MEHSPVLRGGGSRHLHHDDDDADEGDRHTVAAQPVVGAADIGCSAGAVPVAGTQTAAADSVGRMQRQQGAGDERAGPAAGGRLCAPQHCQCAPCKRPEQFECPAVCSRGPGGKAPPPFLLFIFFIFLFYCCG